MLVVKHQHPVPRQRRLLAALTACGPIRRLHRRVNDLVFARNWSEPMPAVNSSAIKFIDYNRENSELYITFSSGNTYTYFSVPESVYNAFLSAASKGHFYNEHIKNSYTANK